MKKQRVLILCTGNATRSQMAEGLLRHDAGDRFEVFSAGVKPMTHLLPETIAVMREIGIDLSAHRPKHVNEFVAQNFDYVLTVCDHARQVCPTLPGVTTIHHAFVDPGNYVGSEEERLAQFRHVRDQIREYLRTFPQNSKA